MSLNQGFSSVWTETFNRPRSRLDMTLDGGGLLNNNKTNQGDRTSLLSPSVLFMNKCIFALKQITKPCLQFVPEIGMVMVTIVTLALYAYSFCYSRSFCTYMIHHLIFSQ